MEEKKNKHTSTHQILIVHAVDVRSYDGEVFHPLRRWRVRYVESHLEELEKQKIFFKKSINRVQIQFTLM